MFILISNGIVVLFINKSLQEKRMYVFQFSDEYMEL